MRVDRSGDKDKSQFVSGAVAILLLQLTAVVVITLGEWLLNTSLGGVVTLATTPQTITYVPANTVVNVLPIVLTLLIVYIAVGVMPRMMGGRT